MAEKIVKDIRQGLPPDLAAMRHGVRRSTYREWIQRGLGLHESREPEPLYEDFADSCERARAEYGFTLLRICNEHLMGFRQSKVKKNPDGSPKMVRVEKGSGARAGEAHFHMSRRFAEYWGSGLESEGVGELLSELQAGAPAEEAPVINITLAVDPDTPVEPEPDPEPEEPTT